MRSTGYPPNTKNNLYERQKGFCPLCGKGLSKSGAIIHHVINRSQTHGHPNNSEENLQLRHPDCERKAHLVHQWGNPSFFDFYAEPVSKRQRKKGRGIRRHGGKRRK